MTYLRTLLLRIKRRIKPIQDSGAVHAASVAWAIEAANIARTKGGAKRLTSDRLPYSTHEGNSQHCVLAKLFNFDCMIKGFMVVSDWNNDNNQPLGDDSRTSGWGVGMSADKQPAAKALAKALGTTVLNNYTLDPPDVDDPTAIVVPLPAAIGRIASDFDKRRLPAHFVQDSV